MRSVKNEIKQSLHIGLTGGIGSGKTLAARIWQRLGRPIIEVDLIARQVIRPGSPLLQEICDYFGQDILLASGELNRNALRHIIFNDDHARKKLEATMHPVIRKEVITRFAQYRHMPMVILSSPLLFETGQDKIVDKVVVVDVSQDIQIKRVIQRDANSCNLVKKIMKTQLSREDRLQNADFILDNSKNIFYLARQIRQLDKLLTHDKR